MRKLGTRSPWGVLLAVVLLHGCGKGAGAAVDSNDGAAGIASSAVSPPSPSQPSPSPSQPSPSQPSPSRTSPSQSSTTCTADADCVDARCCASTCTAVTSDRDNCGACGVACSSTQECVSGGCVDLVCTPPMQFTSPTISAADDSLDVDVASTDEASANAPGANGCAKNESCTFDGTDASCTCGDGPACKENEECGPSSAVAGSGGSFECSCGGGPSCAPMQTCCGDTCADMSSNPQHCGACGNVCPEGARCSAGECVCPDPDGIVCDGRCVTPNTDAHCGGCDPCTGAPGASCQDVDEDGTFECACDKGFMTECDGVCVRLDNASNCGSCGNTCTSPAAICDLDVLDCVCPGYPDDALCDVAGTPTCVSVTGTDSENCGGCGVTCDAGESCDAGSCTCDLSNPNWIFCDRGGDGDPDDYACSDPLDEDHCFGCGNRCGSGAMCDASTEGCICVDDAETLCDGDCHDTETDADHCGGCGVACPDGVSCVGGECDCPGAQLACDVEGVLTCIDVSEDPNHCGACGVTCGVDETCCDGGCRPDSYFVDRDDDCGSCGNVCPSTGCGLLNLFACSCQGTSCQ